MSEHTRLFRALQLLVGCGLLVLAVVLVGKRHLRATEISSSHRPQGAVDVYQSRMKATEDVLQGRSQELSLNQ